jgi:hypothetical protein
MLPAKDRDWIQRAAIETRESWRRGSEWHGTKGAIGYLIGGMVLLCIGGAIFGNREIGTVGAALAACVAIGLGAYYYNKEQIHAQNIKRRMETDQQFRRRGLYLSHDGLTVTKDGKNYDPLSSTSYGD